MSHALLDVVENRTHQRQYEIYHTDAFKWLEHRESNSIHAVVTDPPYGLVEYSKKEQKKLRRGRGAAWTSVIRWLPAKDDWKYEPSKAGAAGGGYHRRFPKVGIPA